MRLEKTCAFKDFSTLRALPCDQPQTQTVENRHQSPRESATDSCQRSFAREKGKKNDSFSELHRSGHRCIVSISCAGTLGRRFSTWSREEQKKPLEISPPGASVPHLTTNPLSSRRPVKGSGRTVGKSRGHRPWFARPQAKKRRQGMPPINKGTNASKVLASQRHHPLQSVFGAVGIVNELPKKGGCSLCSQMTT